MKRHIWVAAAFAGMLLFPTSAVARDFGVLFPPIHKGKFTSSLLYEMLKVREDFDSRGRADFESHVVGAQFTYGLTDTIAVGVKGGSLLDPEERAQATTWKGRAGYLYGVDLYNEVFPATGVWPGLVVSAGASGFHVPLHQTIDAAGTVTLVDQRLTGIDYHAAGVLAMKFNRVSPYTGVKLFGRSVDWHDNQPAANQPANITGESDGNAAWVVGLPIRITDQVQFHVEAVLITQTAITAGFTIAAF